MRKNLLKRLAFILICFLMLSPGNMGFAQKVSLNYSQQSLKNVLQSISRQTGYTLAYSKEVVDLNDNVSIQVQNADLSVAMAKLFASRNLSYEIKDKKIYIADNSHRTEARSTASQQTENVQIRGKVTDENGEPVIGASVAVPNTGIGTITNIDGDYSLSVPRGSLLRISFVGYVNQEFTITNQSVLNAQLREDVASLEELIVIGYGVQKKSVVTAAISRVTAEDLAQSKPSRIEDVLKGKVSGVQITQSSGHPGADSKVRIRGIGTINNSDPLYIVDGMPVDGGIAYLNPADIQSVEILKDAASAAIYGTRAANGVVLITTKTGSVSKGSINYNFSYGWQNPWKKKRMLNATEYMTLMNEAALNDGGLPVYGANAFDKLGGAGTDWQDATFNYDAPIQSHQISASGGSQNAQYFLSAGYFSQEGIIGGNFGRSNYDRFSVRSNTTFAAYETKERSFLNKLDVGVNMGYSRVKSTGVESNSEYGSILGSAIGSSPLSPIYAPETSEFDFIYTQSYIENKYPTAVRDAEGRLFSLPTSVFQELANPLAMLNQPGMGRNNEDKFVGTFWGELSLLPGLKFKSSFGTDLAFWGYDSYNFPYFMTTQGKEIQRSDVQSEMNRGMKWQLENVLSYNKTFNEVHNFSAVLGQSAIRYSTRNLGGYTKDLLMLDPIMANINSGTADKIDQAVWGGTNGFDYESLASYFGRVIYNFDERYMAQASVRRDGSSRFGPNNKWAIFPAFSLGWNVHNESFMENRPDWFNALKIRYSWGSNGNERMPNFRYVSRLDGGQNYYYGGGYIVDSPTTGTINGTMQYGSSPAGLPNPSLKWEHSVQSDFGFDAQFFNSALTFSFDYYTKKTNGMLIQVPIPAYVGQGSPWGNVGDMKNSGLEFELGWKQVVNDFKYHISANASYAKNILVNLGNATGETILENAGASGVGSYVKGKNGEVYPYFYGFKTDGIFQNQTEVDAYVNADGVKYQPQAKPGDVRFVDFDGDGVITDDDKTKIGKGMPDWTFGSTMGAEWKGFDVNFFFQGTYGNDMYDFFQRGDIPAMNRPAWMLQRWHGEGTSNFIPRMTSKNENANWRSSDLYIKDGSYLRLKTAQLGYTLPYNLTRQFSVQQLRLFVSAENLFTWTKYDGFDPEIASGGYTTIGIDRGVYPQSRTISVGANITF